MMITRGQIEFLTDLAAMVLSDRNAAADRSEEAAHDYVGMWVTADGEIRQQLLPNGRYVEGRGTREGAYKGRYWIDGTRILYLDETGFEADGEFRGDVLYHAGMVMYRRR